VGVSKNLADFLPAPLVGIIEEPDDDRPALYGFITPENTIGRIKAFNGHFGMFVRAYTYIAMHGAEGLRQIAEYAVLNANYLRVRLDKVFTVPFDRLCMHEFVAKASGPMPRASGRWISLSA